MVGFGSFGRAQGRKWFATFGNGDFLAFKNPIGNLREPIPKVCHCCCFHDIKSIISEFLVNDSGMGRQN